MKTVVREDGITYEAHGRLLCVVTDRSWQGVASSNGLESAKSGGRVSRKAGAIQIMPGGIWP